MICNCRECHRAYWRYTASHPPRGFCQLLCADARRALQKAAGGREREIPVAILQIMRSHRRIIHHVNDTTAWFDQCPECERLETRYAAALREAASKSPCTT